MVWLDTIMPLLVATVVVVGGWLQALPGMYHVILGYYIFAPNWLRGHKRELTLAGPIEQAKRVWLADCDWNMHLSNSSYFKTADSCRIELIKRSGLWALSRKNGWFLGLGGTSLQFRREIKPFQRFVVRTQVRGWDTKWLFVQVDFLVRDKSNHEVIAATGYSKIVCKRKREDVPWEDVWKALGISTGPSKHITSKGTKVEHDPLAAHVRHVELELQQAVN